MISIDKQLIKARFAKATTSYEEEATVQRQIAEKMTLLMKKHIHTECWNLLEVGCGTGIFSRLLLRHFKPQKMIINDICPEMERNLTDILNQNRTFICGDAESQSFSTGIDVIASCSTIQWFTNLDLFFKHCHVSLNDAGFLVISTFGKDNMKEMNSITGAVLLYRSKSELEQELLSLNYDIIHISEEMINKTFASPMMVLHHLKRTGVTGIKKQTWSKGKLEEFCREYDQRYCIGNSVSLTYHPIYIIAKKKNNEK